ncbi:Peptidase M28 family protein [Klebsormidium nitens]|uniref:Carboxypeptidase Q n=1 Tax=Klebsormidium nitens TaxID=105231 RepID=A0A0U9HJ30_KLENI|nr:Peptidase M28 family protein [Klebsormidium nitens]|eukprot:GAQ81823.1 Peptidase M28 family protein [Klebsormidium nitens]
MFKRGGCDLPGEALCFCIVSLLILIEAPQLVVGDQNDMSGWHLSQKVEANKEISLHSASVPGRPFGRLQEILQSIKLDVEQIIVAASSTDVVFERLAYVADTFGPRFSGTSGLELAIDHIKAEMQRDGLSVTEEPVMVPRWVRGAEQARLVSPRNKTLAMVGLGDSIGTGGKPIVAPVLVVSSFADLALRRNEAAGRIVVFNTPFVSYGETVDYRSGGAAAAAAAGGVAALVRSVTSFSLQTPHAGTTDKASVPAAAITVEDAELLARMQRRGQEPVVELYMEAQTLPDVQSRNLIVEIRGSERPDEVVMFGGHIDSWDITDGAIDDGGGAMITWELSPPAASLSTNSLLSLLRVKASSTCGDVIRLLHSLGLQPRRTVRGVLFVNEENGARGGQQYARDHASEMNRTSIAIETDAGTFTPYGLEFTGTSEARAILEEIGRAFLSEMGLRHVTDSGGGTDVYYTCALGVPCASLSVLDPRESDGPNNPCRDVRPQGVGRPTFGTSAYFWYHHSAADTPDKMSPQQLQQCAASLATWVYAIASLDEILPRGEATVRPQ